MVDAIPHPIPAAKAMPEWFKVLGRDIPNQDKTHAGTIKRCIPVLDAISQGYIIPLWGDLHIKVTQVYALKDASGSIVAHVNELEDNPNDVRGKEFQGHIIESAEPMALHIWCKFPDGFDAGSGKDISNHGWSQVGELCDLKKFELGKVLLKFANPWVIETPIGWSVQFKNPANDWSNDIHILEGVVDTDKYHQQVNFPYIWTGSEVGEWIIPKGTPLIQVIPFRRNYLPMDVKTFDLNRMAKVQAKLSSVFSDRYRRFFWHKSKDS